MTANAKRHARVQAKPERARDGPRSGLVSLWDWRAQNSHLFPSDTSLRWHLRRHRDSYTDAGALLELAGRFVIEPQKFEQTLRQVGQRVAAERPAVEPVGGRRVEKALA
jgi:hypothetical protein